MGQTYPAVPITAADVTRAYVRVITFTGGAKGDDVDVATANSTDPYTPRTQSEKASLMVPAGSLAVDVARPRGSIAPNQPYPKAGDPPLAAPVVSSLAPATAAAGSAPVLVTVTGTGFSPWSKVFTGAQTIPERFQYVSPTTMMIMIDPRSSTAGTASVAIEDHDVMSNTDKVFTFS